MHIWYTYSICMTPLQQQQTFFTVLSIKIILNHLLFQKIWNSSLQFSLVFLLWLQLATLTPLCPPALAVVTAQVCINYMLVILYWRLPLKIEINCRWVRLLPVRNLFQLPGHRHLVLQVLRLEPGRIPTGMNCFSVVVNLILLIATMPMHCEPRVWG